MTAPIRRTGGNIRFTRRREIAMVTLSHEMSLGIKQAVIIKIANAPTGNTAQKPRIVWGDFEEMSNCKRSERRKPVHDGAPPCGIRAIGAKEMQETVDE